MANICNICLRSDLNLHTLSEELENFYEELCNFNNISKYMFCSVCIYKLLKCYDFKKTCILAGEKLKAWKDSNDEDKTPKYLLYTEMPTTLAISDNDNRKIYFYQDPNFDEKIDVGPIEDCSYSKRRKVSRKTKVPKQTVVSKAKKLIKKRKSKEVIYSEKNVVKSEISETKREKSAIENDTTKKKYDIEIDTTKKISDIKTETTDNDDFETDIHQESIKYESDSDSTVKKKTSKIKQKNKISKDDDNNRVISIKSKKFNIEDVKRLLKLKFESHGEVKDEKGNVIDPETVFKNLDKYSDQNLIILKRIGSNPGPFKPTTIQRLSKIQDRFKAYEKVFEITYLSDEKQMAEEFKNRRKYPEYLNQKHRCEKCFKGFRNAKTLENHNKSKHDDSLPFSCPLCDSHYATARMAHTHVRDSHSMVYKCKMCANFTTNCRGLMLRHYSTHTVVMHTCKECGKQYRNASSLYVHLKIAHVLRHICRLCAGAYHTANGLNMHMTMRHTGEEFTESPDNVKCEQCDIIFLNNDVYNKHFEVTHTPKDKDETAPSVRKRKYQKRSKYVYACRLCDWKGAGALSRINHHNEAHPTDDIETLYGSKRKHLCHSCGKGFKDQRSYTEHMNKHTNVRPYSCSICSKGFFTRSTLEVHTERHFPPQYECRYCQKMFTTRTGLNNHMKIHIGDRRFKCEVCGKGFIYAAALKEHVNGVHLQIRRKRKHCALEDNDMD